MVLEIAITLIVGFALGFGFASGFSANPIAEHKDDAVLSNESRRSDSGRERGAT
jgi:hypothetical protein